MTEHHCHILPGVDDGSKNVEMSLQMIKMMRQQGVSSIIATPHFYAHREESIERYLEKRTRAYESLVQADPANADIKLGAEVAIERGISRIEGIEKLCLAGTDYILLELPYNSFSHWYIEEITDLCYEHDLYPIIAHVHRYLDYYSDKDYEQVLSLDAIFQINNEAFENHREKKFVKKLIKEGYPYLFGSDAHNLTDRKPNWDLLQKKAKVEVIEGAEKIL